MHKDTENKTLTLEGVGAERISSEAAARIIEDRKPLGLFILHEQNVVVAIDNTTGDAWTEEFPDLPSALAWLGNPSISLWDAEETSGSDAETKYYLQIYYHEQSTTDLDTAEFTVPATEEAFLAAARQVVEAYKDHGQGADEYLEKTDEILDRIAAELDGEWRYVKVSAVVTVNPDSRALEEV